MSRKYLPEILIAVFLFAIHLSYIPNGFTWLDHGDIELGRAVLPLNKLPLAFVTRLGETAFYRPYVTIMNSLDYAFWGNLPIGFHLSNLLIHMLAGISAVLFIGLFFSLNRSEKLLVFIIIGIHPLGFLPVGIVSYRQELLFSFLAYLSVYFYVVNRKSVHGRRKDFWLFLLCFSGSILSKETAIILIPLLILYWELLNLKTGKKRNSAKLLTGVIIILIIYSVLRIIAVPEIWHGEYLRLSFKETLGTRANALYRLIFALFLPFKPDLSDATTIIPIDDPFVILTTFAYIGIFGFIFKMKNRNEWLKAAGLFFILLLPAMNFIPVPRFYSPHYGYVVLPAVAFFLILAARKFNKIIAQMIVWTFVIFSAVSTFWAGFRFRNDLTLFAPEVQKDDRFREGHHYLGDYYLRNGKYTEAETHYLKALNKKAKVIAFVDENAVMNNLAGVYLQEKKLDKADGMLVTLAGKIGNQDDHVILYNRAVIADKKGDYKKVIELLDKPEINWQNPEAKLILEKAKKSI